jgi:hypothetical protein
VQEAETIGMEGGGHGSRASHYIRFLFALNYVVGDAEWVAKV